jgi:2-methylisocitrate lyase-like PEP mutase family enzyme
MNAFAKLHAGPEILILPNAWDAGSARVTEVAGARAIATSSAAVAWANGYPDGEALPFDLLLGTVREIARMISVPLTADVEAGYADDGAAAAESVMRVRDAGAAGINIEDGTGSPDLLCAKIERIKMRLGDDIWINARTDVYLHNLASGEAAYEETIKRARRYREAGADSIFVPMAAEDALLVRLVAAIDAPLNLLAWPGLPPAARLKEIGVRRLSAGSGVARMSQNRTFELARDFLADGRSEPLTAPLSIPGGLNAIMRRD